MPRFELLEDRLTPAVHDLTQNTTFTTIQAAINAANPGDTILADAGVYAENVVVNKALVLEGAQHGVDAQNGRPGAQESILDAATNNGQTLFNITASNVTIDGFTVQNATNANVFGFGILVGAGTSGTQLLNNIVQDNIAGISLANNSTSSQTVIRQNLIQNNNQAGPITGTGIYSDQFNAGGTLSDVLIDNNTFKGNSDAGLDFSSTDATKPATGITISNNLFDTNARGLLAFNLTSSSIRLNTFSNSTSNATADIRLFEGVNGVTITNNLLQNGAGRAVRISNAGTGAPDASNIQFNQNSIAGYTGPAGIFQVDNYSGTLNATNNWWGSATGPSTPNNPGGTGQTLVDPNNQVVFSPLLTDGTNISSGRGFEPVQADLALTKTGPATATAGMQVTYTLSLTNPGPSDSQGVTLTDTLPSGETFVSASEGNGAGTSFTDSIGTLAAGASRTITLVTAISPSTPAGTLTNNANVSSTTFDANLANNAATLDTTISTSADVAITKTGPASVTAGTDVTYTLTTNNNGPSDAQNVMTSDTPPANTTLVSFVQDSGPPDGGTLPAGASQTFTLVLHLSTGAIDGSTITNTAQVTSTTSDPNANNNSATVNSTVVNAADVAITKTGPATVTAGTDVTYTLTTTNNGPVDAQNVMTSDTPPANTTLVSFTQVAGAPDGGPLAAGASQAFVLVLHLNASVASGSTITNMAQVSSTTFDPNANNNTATATSTVATSGDLALTKTGPATATPGTQVTYTLSLTNNGPSDAQGVSLTDTLPAGMTFVSASEGTGAGTSFVDAIGTLAVSASRIVTLVAQVSPAAAGATLTDSATVSSTTSDPNAANNTATFNTTIGAGVADLAITKTGPATITAGTNVTYTLSISNNGPSDAQNVTLTDTLPPGTTFVSASAGTGSGTSYSDSIGTLSAGASDTVTVVAKLSSSAANGSTITNSATVSSSASDTNAANNTATFDSTASTSADLAITKSSPGTPFPALGRPSVPVPEGSPFTYTISVTNNGPSDAQAVVITDTLPPGVTFDSANFGPGTVTQSGNTVTADFGTIASGFGIVGTIVVTPTEQGTIVNTASVTSSSSDPNAQNNSASAHDSVLEGTISAPATAVNGFERTPLTNVTVARFSHANGIEPASAFSATITWGDGTSSPGTVTLSTGTYSVQGSHTYLDEHVYSIGVTLREESVTTVILTPATILEELLPGGTRGTPNQRFVSEVYRDMLGRQVDAGGLAKWSTLLDGGATQFQVITAIQNDSGHEFLKYEVDLLYQHYLQRSADSLGLNDGVNFLAAGGTQEQLAARLVASPEFNARLTTGSNDSWLDQFYVRALHRGVDPVGRAGWDQAFASGESRAQVAIAIFSSDEYHQVLVNDFYQFLLERPADQSGLSTWSGALRSGVRDEVVMASIMDTDSREFFNKTAP